MPRILLADDHAVVRRQLREMLENEPDFVVCGEASTGRHAVMLTACELPDIVVLDLSMPQLNGLDAAREIHARFPQIEMIILTMYDPLEFMDQVIASGVRTCILKTDLHLLVATLRSIWQQHQRRNCGSFADPSPETLQGSIGPEAVDDPAHALTEFECQIVRMLAQAKRNEEIAAAFSLTAKAVEIHRAAILRKLKISSMFDLVHYAVQKKLVQTNPAVKPIMKSVS